jgi:carboxypeptidase Q
VISTTATGHGIITIGGASRTLDPATIPPLIVIPAEEYNRVARLLAHDIPVTIEADIRNSFRPNPAMFNVVGEIRGTEKPDEIVILGAHLDSWHASPGATDNIAGSAVMLEAMRILKASGVPLRRTVRVVLWNGEEEGLIGSRLYVAQHFGGVRGAGPAPGRGEQAILAPITPDHAKFQAYFNVDNGSGAIRGIYLQQNAALAPVFRAWMEPLRNLGATHIAPGNTGSTDHVSFDSAGLPGFQFIQDSIEYNVFTHHTNLDTYDQLQPDDMRRNATIVATFAYLAANRDDLLPRKPATAAAAAAGGGRGG